MPNVPFPLAACPAPSAPVPGNRSVPKSQIRSRLPAAIDQDRADRTERPATELADGFRHWVASRVINVAMGEGPVVASHGGGMTLPVGKVSGGRAASHGPCLT
jgi:hypothetical protein